MNTGKKTQSSRQYRIGRFTFLLSLVATLIASPVAYAVDYTLDDEQSRIANGIFYSGKDDACGANTEPVALTPGDSGGGGDPRPILEFFTGKGLTLAAAAGFIGNMKQESGLNPLNVENASQDSGFNVSVNGGGDAKLAKDNGGKMYTPIDGTGFGLVQWTWGGYKAGRTNPDKFEPRQGGLYHFAVERNMDIADLNLQLEYVWHELTHDYKTSTLDKIDGLSDPVQAAIIIHDNYEISADTDAEVREVRGGEAQRVYDKYKGEIADGTGATSSPLEVTGTSGETCSSKDSNSTGGIGVAGDVTFPLRTTQAIIKAGIDGAVWCFSSPTNCHHDYNAADIFAPTGTDIIAAKPGKVVSKTDDSCDYYGCNVSVKGDDGLLYYYTHMDHFAVVNVGQKVTAGQKLGKVGTNATAMNTPRHLHFDITRGNFRPSCSGATCNDDDFINVQSVLVPAFNALPKGAEDV